MPDLATQLMLLKSVTHRMGIIHEAQKLQLQVWPMLLKGVKNCQVEVDINKRSVVFRLEPDKNFKKTKRNQELMVQIVKWVRWLLWDDATVQFIMQGQIIYGE